MVLAVLLRGLLRPMTVRRASCVDARSMTKAPAATMAMTVSENQSESGVDLKNLSVKIAETKLSSETSSNWTSYVNAMMTLSAEYLSKNNAPIK